MKNIFLNFDKFIGKVKPMHCINNGPIIGANPSMFHFLGKARIPY